MIWQDRLASGRVLLLDGGTGSELRRRGVGLSPAAWSAAANVERYRMLVDIHADYIRAGADIVTANTFSTTRFVLEAAGLGTRFEEINALAIDAALEARYTCGRDAAVAASLSCMPPGFDPGAYPDAATELAGYRELAAAFAERGVDLVLLEMMQDDTHAARACAAVVESGLPFWLGLSCRIAPNAVASAGVSTAAEPEGTSDRLVAFDLPGTDFDTALAALLPCKPSAVCVMHSPVDAIGPALVRLRERWAGVIGAYAEIGYPEDPESVTAARTAPDAYAREASGWFDAGARIIGGCCGTTPEHIRALAELFADRM